MTDTDEWNKNNMARADKLEEASVNAATEGIKALLLLNGGACVALLGFLASTMGHDKLNWSETLFVVAATKALGYFATGAGTAVFVTLCAYLANQQYSSHLRWPERYQNGWNYGDWLVRCGLILVVTSLALFGRGVYLIWDALP